MIGKVNDDFFTKAILAKTGCENGKVVIGPSMGVDSAILKVPGGFMAIAEDPIFPSVRMSPKDFAYVTVHIGASDVAVMGIKPEFMTYSLLLPPDTEESYIAALIREISAEAKRQGIAIVGGHTGYYGAVTCPTIGGISVWGYGKKYVSPKGAKAGDDLVITKGIAIEAAALLGFELGEALEGKLESADIRRAAKRMKEISVVKDAEIASRFSGVHAMHDATEGGVKRGVWEVAEASGKGVLLDADSYKIPKDIANICRIFGLSPWEIISEGTLVIAVSPKDTEPLQKALAEAGIRSAVIGKFTDKKAGRKMTLNGVTGDFVPPAKDFFWDVFFNAANILSQGNVGGVLSENEKLCRNLKAGVDRLKAANICKMLPEIGTNIGYTETGTSRKDVCAVPGRIFRVEGETYSVRDPKMGISVYMADTLLAIRKKFPEAKCVANFRSSPKILAECKKAKFRMVEMPTPKDYRQIGDDYDRDLEKVLAEAENIPDIIAIPDRINLEKLILVVGKSLEDFESKVLRINGAL